MVKSFTSFVGFLPKTRIGNYCRTLLWKKILGNESILYFGHQANIVGGDFLTVGQNFTLGDFASIEVGMSDPVYIGSDVSMARYSYIRSANHNFSSMMIPIRKQGHTAKKINFQGKIFSIVIEDDVLIGAFSVILSGTHIGRGSVIAAGSVLSGRFPEFSIIVGNPARAVGNRRNSF
jgi:acetyltransferase-like isoleucine patch superfamily enzyme